MPTSTLHSVSVAAVVVQNDQILVIQRHDNGHWEPPGGVLELDETFEAGVRREVHEETGYEIEPEYLSGIYKNMTHGIVAFVFKAKLCGGRPHTSSESVRVGWWTPQQVAQHMDEAFAVRVLDALRDDQVPAIRTHDGRHVIPTV